MAFDADLGPLRYLQGTWEGEGGVDVSPSDYPPTDRCAVESKFREKMVFEPMGRVDNHEQQLFGLRYSTRAWRIGGENPFHEELGYWLWDPASQLVIRSFMPPRGITVMAGGRVEPDAREFRLEAESGSEIFGICSNPFLEKEFKTVRYTLHLKLVDEETLFYDEHMWLKIPSKQELFDHRDVHTLKRTS